MTKEIYRKNAYLRTCTATVIFVNDEGVVLDQTVFYPTGGGQPGDTGVIQKKAGAQLSVVDTRKDREDGKHFHFIKDFDLSLNVGDPVIATIDWQRRYSLMRMHSALHLLCAVVEGGVTGGQIGEYKSRLDFNLVSADINKNVIEGAINDLVQGNYPLNMQWISDCELEKNQNLVRTMSVKPPVGLGKIRLIEIKGIDLQPCGGTHVSETGEIGKLIVGKIENKGKHNRRIYLHLADVK